MSDWKHRLPTDFQKQIEEVTERSSKELIFDGSISTSLHTGDDIVTGVVDGDVVLAELPWLYSLYENEFREVASKTHGTELMCSLDRKNSININSVFPDGGGYERHLDTNHVTGLLFVTDTLEPGSGDLVFHFGEEQLHFAAQQGILITFRGTDQVHSVTNRILKGSRLTVVMNYYESEVGYERPEDLDASMY